MRAQWPHDMMESWRHEKLALELSILDAEAERDRNSEASKIMQKFQAGQLQGLRATLSQSQVVHPTVAPQSATPRMQLFLRTNLKWHQELSDRYACHTCRRPGASGK
ncbi:hypothetical protein PC129_g24642 [Phytophthora cactorum]|uniref:Uncharacterized protein n=1 Tax=Phytophthora cactorum TaxID=29920 RepID=A0A8T1AMK3_9STRA|nr:hypothetical protein Pcac1_g27499 [Phytophthora cactorum]KAG2796443.1 hypothetical protein PC111_g21721 [Phytophthora cactorum]KAG2796710.1 hypothetical protein PC112_g22088 [Phytophthora cactorum]KAG2824544.1 hypothetical protein PC113_g22018 [Phytophthora cactorum]KAG2876044.1 hypothetical protein PC114_g24398 [Phytophthora cactorum]